MNAALAGPGIVAKPDNATLYPHTACNQNVFSSHMPMKPMLNKTPATFAATTNRRRNSFRSRIGLADLWQRLANARHRTTPATIAPIVARSAQPHTSLCEMPSTTSATPENPSAALA